MKPTNLFVAAAVASTVAGAALAQSSTFDAASASDGVTAVTDAINDDQRDVTFGTEGRVVGTYGSVALRYTSSNSTSADDVVSLGIGANYGYFDGVNGSEFNLAYTYGSTNGVEDKNTVLSSYDFYHNFNPNFFGYAKVNLNYDNLATGTSNKQDAFAGFGVGYRVINTNTTQLALKAGPGYRHIEQGNGTTADEAAYSVEANYSQQLTDTVYLTNDLTLIGSKLDTTATNELALNVAVTNALSLRTSYVSDFSGPDIGSLTNGDNTLGVSVVYNFN